MVFDTRSAARVGGWSIPSGDARSGTPLAFLIVDGPRPRVQIGSRACADEGSIVFGIFVAAGWLAGYLLWALTTRPWWDRRRIVDTGNGRL